MVLKVVGTKSVTVTVFSVGWAGAEGIVPEGACVDELTIRVVWAVLVNVGVTVIVIGSPSGTWDPVDEAAEVELDTGGAAPPSALRTVASSQQPICTPTTVFIGRA